MARTTRPHRSAAERQQLVAKFERGGLSQRAFCERHGISKNTLANWRRRLASEASAQASPFVDLTPCTVWIGEVALDRLTTVTDPISRGRQVLFYLSGDRPQLLDLLRLLLAHRGVGCTPAIFLSVLRQHAAHRRVSTQPQKASGPLHLPG
jgi:transposase-like protein